MCKKCSENSCSGCSGSGSNAQTASDIAILQDSVEQLQGLTKFLNGHPIISIDDSSDIVQFNLSTGIGNGDWIGWGLCNGNTYIGPTINIATPDLRDKFLVGALGSYTVGDTGGVNTVTLDITMIPPHTHAITDPGHTHIIDDPGHDHNVTDPGHTHAASAGAHQHNITSQPTSINGDHNHPYDIFDPGGATYNLDTGVPPLQATLGTHTVTTSNAGTHSHTVTGVTDSANANTVITAAFTGIDMDDAFTGITNDDNTTGITINNIGGGLEHENRPPYYALIFIKKIY